MPGKHLLIETVYGGENGIPDGTLQTPSHPGIVKNRVVCTHQACSARHPKCRCGGPCGNQLICDDTVAEELKLRAATEWAEEEWQNENERHKMEDIELGGIALHG